MPARGKVSLVISNHAAGGERCELVHAANWNTGKVISQMRFINPGDGRVTFDNYYDPTNGRLRHDLDKYTEFSVRCMRRWASGDAGISGVVQY
jgi:hypothetical protein